MENHARPPTIDPERFHSEFETALDNADNGAIPDELLADIQDNLDELQEELEIYRRTWDWSNHFVLTSEDRIAELLRPHLREKINTHGMTKGMQQINDARHLLLPQPPVHEFREMEQLVLLALDKADEPKSVGELAAVIAGLLRATLVSRLEDTTQPDDSDPFFVHHAHDYLDDEELDQMEESFEEKLSSRIQYNLGSLDEKQYIARRKDPADKRRTVIELTMTGELWVDTHNLSQDSQDPIESILNDEVASYLGVEKE